MNKTLTASVFTVAMLAIGTGCALHPAPYGREDPYNIGVYNSTNADIRKIRIWWPLYGKEWWAFDGRVDAGRTGEVPNQPDPIPEKANLQWRTPDGVMHFHEIAIAKTVPDVRTFEGTIWLEFYNLTDTGYRVRAVSNDERARQGKELPIYPPGP